MSIRRVATAVSREDYEGPDFATLKPFDERQAEVWTYKENKRLGLYNHTKAEQVVEVYNKDAMKMHLKELRKKAKAKP